jgi:hypothetical protein
VRTKHKKSSVRLLKANSKQVITNDIIERLQEEKRPWFQLLLAIYIQARADKQIEDFFFYWGAVCREYLEGERRKKRTYSIHPFKSGHVLAIK